MKGNVKAAWLRAMVQERDDIVALDSALMLHPRCGRPPATSAASPTRWSTAASASTASAPTTSTNASCPQKPSKPPGQGPNCDLTEARDFNLMFETTIGPVEESGTSVYLRPETAQGIFVNFKNVLQIARRKPPFGIAQVGKSFRNEITPGNFIFRTREFEQMEMEFFVPPGRGRRVVPLLGRRARGAGTTATASSPSNLRVRAHEASELSHYSSATSDLEYLYPIGWAELEGIANRGDYDLNAARRVLGHEARVRRAGRRALRAARDRARGRRRPRVPGLPLRRLRRGGGRRAASAWCCACTRASRRSRPRSCRCSATTRRRASAPRRSPPSCAPHFQVELDTSGAIGRRYRRQDEIGTPWAVTIDHESLEDDAVTVRDRDSLEQVRVPIGGRAARCSTSA